MSKDFLLFFYDEIRYGLISNYRRSWSPVGMRTIIDNQQEFKNGYLFSAVNPITGDSFHLIGFDENSSSSVSLFFDYLEKEYHDNEIVVVFDNAPSHRPDIVRKRKHITCISLPPYSPELNPAERFFGEARKSTANRMFKTIEEQEEIIGDFVKTISEDTERMKQLLGYDWIREQMEWVS